MRATSIPIRFALAALFALLLAVRSLAPAGFMPAFEHGAVTIVACPDAGGGDSTPMHHRGDHKRLHQTCPYAASSATSAVGTDWVPLVPAAVVAAALLLGRTFLFIERRSSRERPPAIGPPILA